MNASAGKSPPPSSKRGSAPFLAALKLSGLKCLAVGEGKELTSRVLALLEAGAKLSVVSTAPDAELEALAADARIALERREFEASDLDQVWFAVLTTRDERVGRAMGDAARVRRVFFCAVDQPSVSTFSHVAVATSESLRVAISTAGKAPALAARLRGELERIFVESNFGAIVGRFVELRRTTAPEDRKAVLGNAAAKIRFTGAIVDDHEQSTD